LSELNYLSDVDAILELLYKQGYHLHRASIVATMMMRCGYVVEFIPLRSNQSVEGRLHLVGACSSVLEQVKEELIWFTSDAFWASGISATTPVVHTMMWMRCIDINP